MMIFDKSLITECCTSENRRFAGSCPTLCFGVMQVFLLLVLLLLPQQAVKAQKAPQLLPAAGSSFFQESLSEASQDTVPMPRSVMLRSVMLPGWGQYTNRQAWKIPLVYGLIGGVAYYAYYANDRYEGYRAAFYNSFSENEDLRFGATPSWINPNVGTDFLRSQRNFYRNRRDFLIIATVLAYGLNVLDAYIFAHMRDFDVSDNLSLRPAGGNPLAKASFLSSVPGLSLRIGF